MYYNHFDHLDGYCISPQEMKIFKEKIKAGTFVQCLEWCLVNSQILIHVIEHMNEFCVAHYSYHHYRCSYLVIVCAQEILAE